MCYIYTYARIADCIHVKVRIHFVRNQKQRTLGVLPLKWMARLEEGRKEATPTPPSRSQRDTPEPRHLGVSIQRRRRRRLRAGAPTREIMSSWDVVPSCQQQVCPRREMPAQREDPSFSSSCCWWNQRPPVGWTRHLLIHTFGEWTGP